MLSFSFMFTCIVFIANEFYLYQTTSALTDTSKEVIDKYREAIEKRSKITFKDYIMVFLVIIGVIIEFCTLLMILYSFVFGGFLLFEKLHHVVWLMAVYGGLILAILNICTVMLTKGFGLIGRSVK